jgi:hypothetical protein
MADTSEGPPKVALADFIAGSGPAAAGAGAATPEKPPAADGNAGTVPTPSTPGGATTDGDRSESGSDTERRGTITASPQQSASKLPSTGAEEPLLEGWVEYVDTTSERPMWFHAVSKASTWFRPTASQPPVVLGEWMEMWCVPACMHVCQFCLWRKRVVLAGLAWAALGEAAQPTNLFSVTVVRWCRAPPRPLCCGGAVGCRRSCYAHSVLNPS